MSELRFAPFLILGFGIAFDLLSLFALLTTLVRRKWVSGFPFVGAGCYVLFMILYSIPMMRSRLTVGQALLGGIVLIALHAAMHWTHIRLGRSIQGLRA